MVALTGGSHVSRPDPAAARAGRASDKLRAGSGGLATGYERAQTGCEQALVGSQRATSRLTNGLAGKFFYFSKIIYMDGQTCLPRLISINRGGCLNMPALVNGLTKAGKAPASVGLH
jgi:hypothetical protein